MTHHTDAELLRDIEEHMRKMWDARLLPAVCWPADLAQRLTQAVRRTPAAPVPELEHAKTLWSKFVELVRVDANAKEVKNIIGGEEKLRGLFLSAAAPQPPEAQASVSNGTLAAPVQLPEPDAWRYTDARGHYRYRGARPGFAVEYPILKPEALYTEQQVRELLAAHGIKVSQ